MTAKPMQAASNGTFDVCSRGTRTHGARGWMWPRCGRRWRAAPSGSTTSSRAPQGLALDRAPVQGNPATSCEGPVTKQLLHLASSPPTDDVRQLLCPATSIRAAEFASRT